MNEDNNIEKLAKQVALLREKLNEQNNALVRIATDLEIVTHIIDLIGDEKPKHFLAMVKRATMLNVISHRTWRTLARINKIIDRKDLAPFKSK